MIKQAGEQNILFKRDIDTFFDPEKETPENFVRNYNQFFRGSTPNEGMRRKLESTKKVEKPTRRKT